MKNISLLLLVVIAALGLAEAQQKRRKGRPPGFSPFRSG
uniref:Vespakinin n=1 Tax=Parapolybia varia TaxID=91407 RepID=A0A3S6I504_9HYME|nr:Vespakinin [Parapolybia varia]